MATTANGLVWLECQRILPYTDFRHCQSCNDDDQRCEPRGQSSRPGEIKGTPAEHTGQLRVARWFWDRAGLLINRYLAGVGRR